LAVDTAIKVLRGEPVLPNIAVELDLIEASSH